MKYVIHGSEDSLDRDVFFLYEGYNLPDMQKCKELCDWLSHSQNVNGNLVLVKDGVVVECYKGTVDEVNNGMLYTYHLHQQDHYLPVKRKVERHVEMKILRTIRGILSMLSRTEMRSEIKSALRAETLREKLDVLKMVDFTKDYDFSKKGDVKDIYKFFAFQLGQTHALAFGKELYTKSEIAKMFSDLTLMLYRKDETLRTTMANQKTLNDFLKAIIAYVERHYDLDSKIIRTNHGTILIKTESYMQVLR